MLPKRYSRRGRLRLAEPPPSGIEMFRCENMFFSYDGVKNVLHDVTFNITRGDKVAVIGYNGLGKTTLMRIIAGTRQPTAGKAVLGHNVVCGYLSQEFAETIPPDLTVYRNAKNAIPPGMNEKNFRNQLGAFGFDENDVEKPAGVLSGGEKIRLAFLRLFLQCPNFLLLDEPTTHLDLDGRALLQDALQKYKGLQDALQKYKGTILLVSHDIEFVRAVATSVIEITREEVRTYPGGYDYYCEKKAQREAAGRAGRLDPPTTARPEASPYQNPTSAAPKLTSKELRQQRAAERAKLAPRVKELKRRVETAERKLDELQKALDTASEELFNPKPTTNFAEVNRQVRTIQFEIDRYTADWEAAATELEKLQGDSKEETT